MFLLDDLLIKLPAKGFMSIIKQIAEIAETELTDESKIQEDLLLLQTLYETDQITEEEYYEKEAALLERLTLVREQKGE
ncbi:MAG TPA: gas vesicle protein GvpG [Ktedonobacteraceae bacterium]|jgi:hypothetical protein|nr:gas vesicle protein GvpG [Ktedonobacteraceae bacterium]